MQKMANVLGAEGAESSFFAWEKMLTVILVIEEHLTFQKSANTALVVSLP